MKLKNKIFLSIFFLIIIFIISLYFFPINIKKIKPSTIIYDKNHIEIGEIINDKKTRHRFIEISKIPVFSKKAIILMEDKNFYNNSGIDFSAIFRAIINNFKSDEKIEGASTISTQVIRNNYWLNNKRGYLKKLKEFYLALVLNKKYSKDKILEFYLNNISFGYLNYGIESASYYYFGKKLNNLTKAEQLSLLILPKNPSKYNPNKNKLNFRKRFEKIANYLEKNGLINKQELNFILSEKLFFNNKHKNKLPYVVDFIKKEKQNIFSPPAGSLFEKERGIQTTIDYNLTQKIDKIAKNVIEKLAWKDVGDYGIIITERKTNNLLVMIGGIDYYTENGQVNSTLALRQVGSTIKPFTYLLAFKDLGYKPSTKILDLPVQFKTKEGNSYSPKNYSLDYKGEVSLAEALSQSINIPAVKLVNEIGLNRLYEFLKNDSKISSINKSAEHYGLALTLGVSEMNLYELLQAYSIFANDGKLCDIKVLSTDGFSPLYKDGKPIIISPPTGTLFEKERCNKVIEKKYTDEIIEILTNRYFKLKGFPINSNLDFQKRNVFVKTGTSRNFRDNWTVGFTDNYMIGVWVGNKDGTYMKGVSGATGAGEIFSKIVKYLEPVNKNISKKTIIFKKNQKKYLEIISPLNESIYKIDRTKPEETNKIKLQFETNKNYDKKQWLINDNKIEGNFLFLQEGIFEIKLKLFQNGKIIGEKKSMIEIKK